MTQAHETTQSDYSTIELSQTGSVATLTMNRPKRSNAFNGEILREMVDAIGVIERDDSIRVAILTGKGKNFSAGADLTGADAGAGGGSNGGAAVDVTEQLETEYRPPLMAITHSAKPWISAVNGAAAGIGSAFAMNCDLTVMADNAYVYQAFGAIGLIPDGGATWHLAQTIGRKRAYEIIVSGEKLSAQRCLDLGLCNRVVPAADLLSEAQTWAESLCEKAPLSLRYAKEAVLTALETDLGTAFSKEATLQAECIASEDAVEGAKAFFQKRKPVFTGR